MIDKDFDWSKLSEDEFWNIIYSFKENFPKDQYVEFATSITLSLFIKNYKLILSLKASDELKIIYIQCPALNKQTNLNSILETNYYSNYKPNPLFHTNDKLFKFNRNQLLEFIKFVYKFSFLEQFI
jgi:hypothetical protein